MMCTCSSHCANRCEPAHCPTTSPTWVTLCPCFCHAPEGEQLLGDVVEAEEPDDDMIDLMVP